MAIIDSIRFIFQDYEDEQIILPKRLDYAFHISESSLRDINQAEQKLQIILSGGNPSTQILRDLRSVYGLVDTDNQLSDLGNEFISFCDTQPNDLAKEFFVYRGLYNSAIEELQNQQINRIKNICIMLTNVPAYLKKEILNDNHVNNKILAFTENIICLPLALKRFFQLDYNDLIELSNCNDNQLRNIQSQLLNNEKYLNKFVSRVITYNRGHGRRRIAIISAMLIPVCEKIDVNGSAPFRVTAPYTDFFSRQQIKDLLSDLNYQVHEY